MEDIDSRIKSLDAHIQNLNNEKILLMKEKVKLLRQTFPVVYTIFVNAETTNTGSSRGYGSFTDSKGCFSTRERAEKYLPGEMKGTRFSINFQVRAEASENLSNDRILNINGPCYVDYSP